jgi:hypothetical protein
MRLKKAIHKSGSFFYRITDDGNEIFVRKDSVIAGKIARIRYDLEIKNHIGTHKVDTYELHQNSMSFLLKCFCAPLTYVMERNNHKVGDYINILCLKNEKQSWGFISSIEPRYNDYYK